MDYNIKGKIALVTGGTRGIGKAIAEMLAEQGATVIITGRSNPTVLPRGVESCKSVEFDNRESLEQFLGSLSSARIDILVNNAGFNSNAPYGEIEPALFEKIQSVNVHTPFRIIQSVLPHMKSTQWGRIVNIASIWSVISKAGRASYSASKFALDGMTVALAAEVAAAGILANCVSPGFIDTDLTRSMLTESEIETLTRQVPLGRLGKPEEIAHLVTFLCSARNTFISGQNIVIDGGFSRG